MKENENLNINENLTNIINDTIRQIIADRYRVSMTIKEVDKENKERIVMFNCSDEIDENKKENTSGKIIVPSSCV